MKWAQITRKLKEIYRNIKKLDRKWQYMIYSIATIFCLAIFACLWWVGVKIYDYNKTEVYEVAIMARSQFNPDPVEDKKSSLKYGDVLAIKPLDHNWSNLEKISFLIIKMELKKHQVIKLTAPKYQKAKYRDLNEEQRDELNDRLKSEGLKEVPREIISPRIYRINMEDVFKGFDPLDLLRKQPYQDKIYNWDIVEKK